MGRPKHGDFARAMRAENTAPDGSRPWIPPGHTVGHHPTTPHEKSMGGDHSKTKPAGSGDRSEAARKAWETRRGGK